MFFLCVDKPPGYTSHDIVSLFRVLTGIKRIGHTGTLDPFATGVLLLAFKDATKLIGHIPLYPKHYQCVLKLGLRTETADCTGTVVDRADVPLNMRELVLKRLPQFTGEITQTPPKYSAIKVNGKRLYEYARQGLDVEIPSRTVQIHYLSIIDEVTGTSTRDPDIGLDIQCSKGTYIRSLGCDLAESIGTVGHLSELRRLASDGVNISDALSLPQLAKLVTHEPVEDWRFALSKEGRNHFTRRTRVEVLDALRTYQLRPEHIFRSLPSIISTKEESLRLAQGMCVDSLRSRLPQCEVIQVLWDEQMLALVRSDGSIVRVNPSIADRRIAQQSSTAEPH